VKASCSRSNNLPLYFCRAIFRLPISSSGAGFPGWFLTQGDLCSGPLPKAHFDFAEPFAGLPRRHAELLLRQCRNGALPGRPRQGTAELRAPLCGALAGCGLMFTWGAISYRYLHDMFPWLVLGSSVAVAYVPSLPRKACATGWPVYSWLRPVTRRAPTAPSHFAPSGTLRSTPYSRRKRMGYLDLSSVIDTGGLHGFLWYLGHWRRYIPAARIPRWEPAGRLYAIGRTQGSAGGPIARAATVWSGVCCGSAGHRYVSGCHSGTPRPSLGPCTCLSTGAMSKRSVALSPAAGLREPGMVFGRPLPTERRSQPDRPGERGAVPARSACSAWSDRVSLARKSRLPSSLSTPANCTYRTMTRTCLFAVMGSFSEPLDVWRSPRLRTASPGISIVSNENRRTTLRCCGPPARDRRARWKGCPI